MIEESLLTLGQVHWIFKSTLCLRKVTSEYTLYDGCRKYNRTTN